MTSAEENECFAQLDAFEAICTSSNRTGCCGLDFTQGNITKCKYTEIVGDIRKASKTCLNSKDNGSLANCMLLVKQTPSLVKNCMGGVDPRPPIGNCTIDRSCVNDCYQAASTCMDKCIQICFYPTPYLNETTGNCTCRPEDALKNDYAKCDGDSCECVPTCEENQECPGFNQTCNENSDNCEYCGGCGDGFGCCTGMLWYISQEV